MKKLIEDKAKNFGVKIESIIEIEPRKVKMDARARWKCKFGCEYYGRASCPPNVPNFEECAKFIKSYKRCIVIIFKFENYMEDKRKAQRLLLDIEKTIMPEHPFAFAIFPGGCDVCDVCDGKSCKTKARPSVSAMCIDITSFNINWKDGYSVGLILIE